MQNYVIFEKYNEYWQMLTDHGTVEVPEHLEAIVTTPRGVVVTQRKHPIKVLTPDELWIVNYSETI